MTACAVGALLVSLLSLGTHRFFFTPKPHASLARFHGLLSSSLCASSSRLACFYPHGLHLACVALPRAKRTAPPFFGIAATQITVPCAPTTCSRRLPVRTCFIPTSTTGKQSSTSTTPSTVPPGPSFSPTSTSPLPPNDPSIIAASSPNTPHALSSGSLNINHTSAAQVSPNVPCRFFNLGQCNKGDRCPFLHKRAAHFSPQACKFYTNGFCRNGDSCPFSHDPKVIEAATLSKEAGPSSLPQDRGPLTSSSLSTNSTLEDLIDLAEYSAGGSSIPSTPNNITPLMDAMPSPMRTLDHYSSRVGGGHGGYSFGGSRPGSYNDGGGLLHDSIPNSFDDDPHPLNLSLGGPGSASNGGMPLSGSSDSNFALHQFIHPHTHQHHQYHPSSASSSPRGGAVLSRRSSSEFINLGSGSMGSASALGSSAPGSGHITGTTYVTLPPAPGSATSPPPQDLPPSKPAPFRRQSSAQFGGYLPGGSNATTHLGSPHGNGAGNSMNFRHALASTSAPSSGRPAPLHRSSSTDQAIYSPSSLENAFHLEDLALPSPASRHSYYRVPPLPPISHIDTSATSSDTYSSPNTISDEFGSNTGNITPSSTSSSFDSRQARRSRTFSGASAATATILGMSSEFGDSFSELGTSDEDDVLFWEFNSHGGDINSSNNHSGETAALKRSDSPTEDSAVPMASVHRRVIEDLLEDDDDVPAMSFSQSSSASTTREISPRYGLSPTPSSNSISTTAASNGSHIAPGTHIAPTAMRRASLIGSNHPNSPSSSRSTKTAGGPPIPPLSRTRKGSFSKSHEDLLQNRDSPRLHGSSSSLLTAKTGLGSSSATLGAPNNAATPMSYGAGNASTAASTAPILTSPHPHHHLSYASAGTGSHPYGSSAALEYNSGHAHQNHGNVGGGGGSSYTLSHVKRPTPIPPKLGSFKSVSSVRLVIPSPSGSSNSGGQNSISNSVGPSGGGRMPPKISKIGKSQSETGTHLSAAITTWRERRGDSHGNNQRPTPLSHALPPFAAPTAPSGMNAHTSTNANHPSYAGSTAPTHTMHGEHNNLHNGSAAAPLSATSGVATATGHSSASGAPGSGSRGATIQMSLPLATVQTSLSHPASSSQPQTPTSPSSSKSSYSAMAHNYDLSSSPAGSVTSISTATTATSAGGATNAGGASLAGAHSNASFPSTANNNTAAANAANAALPSTAYRKPQLCMFYIDGSCRYGETCKFIHGLICPLCNKACLFQDDPVQNEKHNKSCRLKLEIEECRELACALCKLRIVENGLKFGILPECMDVLCVPCLKDYRTSTSKAECPICHAPAQILIPSHSFPQTPERKLELTEGFMHKMAKVPCKYYYSSGTCKYGEQCRFHHNFDPELVAASLAASKGTPTQQRSPSPPSNGSSISATPSSAATPSSTMESSPNSSSAELATAPSSRDLTPSPTLTDSVVQDIRSSGPGKEDAPQGAVDPSKRRGQRGSKVVSYRSRSELEAREGSTPGNGGVIVPDASGERRNSRKGQTAKPATTPTQKRALHQF